MGYAGSEHANVSFFSFGPIKTATALGGGLAILREIGDDDDDDGGGGGGSVDGRRDVQDDRRAVVGAPLAPGTRREP